MHPVLRNILAMVGSLLIGGMVNMGIIYASAYIIPPPEGADVTTMEGLKSSLHLFQPKHFFMPFLAHALGTLIGAFLVTVFAANSKKNFAIAVGVVFLTGGIVNAVMLPAPLWFKICDLLLAYIPMALLGYRLAAPKR